MKSAALIRYDIRALDSKPCTGAERERNLVKIAKLQANLIVAERRELKRLAEVLTYKADIYYPDIGRIYSCDAKWFVDGDKLYHGVIRINPALLTDGHGRTITEDSNY